LQTNDPRWNPPPEPIDTGAERLDDPQAGHRAELGQHNLPRPVGRDKELHPAQVGQRAGLAGQKDDLDVRRKLAHLVPLGHVG